MHKYQVFPGPPAFFQSGILPFLQAVDSAVQLLGGLLLRVAPHVPEDQHIALAVCQIDIREGSQYQRLIGGLEDIFDIVRCHGHIYFPQEGQRLRPVPLFVDFDPVDLEPEVFGFMVTDTFFDVVCVARAINYRLPDLPRYRCTDQNQSC